MRNAINNFASLTSSLELYTTGQAGNINIEAGSISLNSGQVIAITAGEGNAGKIFISADKFIFLQDSDIASSAFSNSLGNGGDIQIKTPFLLLEGNSSINASTSVEGEGGNIKINALDITLKDDSDFGTFVLSGLGGGGNIDITADSVIAFDDSDIFAFAADGQGGNITLDTPAYFGENFTLNSLTSNPDSLENNSRADINATGAVSGSVSIPDVSFIQNSLTDLPNNSINTDELVANSCVSPVGDRQQGKFIITGGQSLPVRPGDGIPSKYPTGEVRNVTENHSSWQPGDPIVEPQGVYRLANGKLVLSRQCSQ
jgi:large exoprotein involved in heme utilization and adhesion